MKKLMLVRHAEAEAYNDKGDFSRELSVAGKNDVVQLAQKLKAESFLPQHFICSSSRRTLATATVIAAHLQLAPPQTNAAIYEASEKTLLNVINYFPDSADFIAMVGHNPGIGYLLLNLTGKVRDIMPCTAVVIVFEDADSWREISHDSGVITYYTSPQQS